MPKPKTADRFNNLRPSKPEQASKSYLKAIHDAAIAKAAWVCGFFDDNKSILAMRIYFSMPRLP